MNSTNPSILKSSVIELPGVEDVIEEKDGRLSVYCSSSDPLWLNEFLPSIQESFLLRVSFGNNNTMSMGDTCVHCGKTYEQAVTLNLWEGETIIWLPKRKSKRVFI